MKTTQNEYGAMRTALTHVAALASLTGLLSVSTQAQFVNKTLRYEVVVPMTTTAWQAEMELPRFDPASGELVAARLGITVTSTTTATAKLYASDYLIMDLGATGVLYGPPSLEPIVSSPSSGAGDVPITIATIAASYNLSPTKGPIGDQVQFFDTLAASHYEQEVTVPPGTGIRNPYYVTLGPITAERTDFAEVVDPTGLSEFVGTVPLALKLDVDSYSGYTFTRTGSGGFSSDTEAGAVVWVEYDYLVPCGPCDGKVTELTLQYNGAQKAQITVYSRKLDTPIFDGLVAPGGQFTVVGQDKQGTLGTEITLLVDGLEAARIHTSCSQPIGPGMVFGPFTIVEGYSRNGGLLCPADNPPTPPPSGDCAPCDGKVTQLTLQYDGTDQPLVEVYDKKGNLLGSVQLDATGLFTIDGADLKVDDKGTLGTEIALVIDGVEVARIHTSCSQPIGPGMVFGPFKIVEGYSRNGGLLCPDSGSQSTSDPKQCDKDSKDDHGKKGSKDSDDDDEHDKGKKDRGDDHGKGKKKGHSKHGDDD